MLERSTERLREKNVAVEAVKLNDAAGHLPFVNDAFDVVLSFYSLEHLYPLEHHLAELVRVLRPGGILAGAIPCEGGLAWGVGRFLTSRRWLKKNTRIDPDKIICWEHPNYAEDVLRGLDHHMSRLRLGYWPLLIPVIDLNLVVTFAYEKR